MHVLQSHHGCVVLAFVDSAGHLQQSLIAPSPDTTMPGKVHCSGNKFPSLQAVIIAYATPPVAKSDRHDARALLRIVIPPADRSVVPRPRSRDGQGFWFLKVHPATKPLEIMYKIAGAVTVVAPGKSPAHVPANHEILQEV